jgi:hypothetical protein
VMPGAKYGLFTEQFLDRLFVVESQ